MALDWLFGKQKNQNEDEGEGPVVIRIEVDGKTYTRRYPDLDMALLRFPQYLADLQATHHADSERE